MAPRNYEVLNKHKPVADANLKGDGKKGYRQPLDREALYKTDGGFEPSRPPKGSGPPYDSDAMHRRVASAKPHRG